MNKKKIVFLGIMLLIGLMLTGCAGYYGGNGYYDFPYYDHDNGYYGYPYNNYGHEWGEHQGGGHERGEHGEHHEGGEQHLR